MYSGKIHKNIILINLLIVIAIAFNLRAPITSIGPIIGYIQEEYNLNSALAGVLTTIPLITFGCVAFIVTYFHQVKAIAIALILILIGEIIRSYTGKNGLFIGMIGIGCGIAIANVILPTFIKTNFPNKTAKMMSMYSLILNLSSIIGILITVPLLSFMSLKNTMAIWSIIALIAIIIYIPQVKNGRVLRSKTLNKDDSNLIANSTAWKITIFMGMQSFIAYSIFTWYVLIINEKGYSINESSNFLLISQIVAIPFSLFGPLILHSIKKQWQVIYLLILCGIYTISFSILLVSNSFYALIISSIFIGCPMGSIFGIALLFISLKSSTSKKAIKLSSIVQGFGYLLASPAPFLLGFLKDYYGTFSIPIIVLIIASILVGIFGFMAYKAHRI